MTILRRALTLACVLVIVDAVCAAVTTVLCERWLVRTSGAED